jgi:hypothetical protein
MHHFQDDVSQRNRDNILAQNSGDEAHDLLQLWLSCMETMDLEHSLLHPEDMVDLSSEQAEKLLANVSESESSDLLLHLQVRKQSLKYLERLLDKMGQDMTLRGLLLSISGKDINEELRPNLVRQLGNYLDQGVSAWHSIDRADGFYTAWKNCANRDYFWLFDDLPEWQDELDILPEDPFDTIIIELRRLGLHQDRWIPYLENLSLELPGWSGMFLWRHLHPDYQHLEEVKVDMTDYLAVRLVLERLYAQRICRKQWQIEASIDLIRWYFKRRRSEFLVRYLLFNEHLPEYLVNAAQRMILYSPMAHEDYPQWQQIADMLWTWRLSPVADMTEGKTLYNHGWPLFRLAQHLGIGASVIRSLSAEQIESLLQMMLDLDDNRSGFIWLQAYERHYHHTIFNALKHSFAHRQGNQRHTRPSAQIIFCMDEREEGFRRHLEERAPDIETLGAAAHFNVPNFWLGLHDEDVSGLCPVVMVPTHEIQEKPQPHLEHSFNKKQQRRQQLNGLQQLFMLQTHRTLLSAALLMLVAAPVALVLMLLKTFAPGLSGKWLEMLQKWYQGEEIFTDLALTVDKAKADMSPQDRQMGFTDTEQADRVEAFLRNMGLINEFSSLVVVMGHGSMSQNNPHLAAYDCGACSGRHSGPNARIVATAANRPQVRAILKQRGIEISDDSWFVGAEHNTCNEDVIWYDVDKIPQNKLKCFEKTKSSIEKAKFGSAHERSRRLASAPHNDAEMAALAHIQSRAFDYSQARPELGHATNAVAFIGRRALTRGIFFDRRMFLISYDPATDDDGSLLERLLLANGPVGAGISLEYYFSTINNDYYGCGSKVTHNVTGLFGVMDGTNSDLRTGLPLQMIEIHEPMRLQIIVESSIERLTQIYQRQPPLQQLIGNGWVLVSVMDPDSGEISNFEPEKGFIPWTDEEEALPVITKSSQWYRGKSEPLSPAIIQQMEGVR